MSDVAKAGDGRPARLPLRTKLGFGVYDLGGNLFFTAMGFFTMTYLTDTVGIGAAAAGTVFLVGKIWDAVIDPFIGYLSDRTKSRWGRRRPYLFLFAIPLMLAMWLFFTNLRIASPTWAAIWATAALCILNAVYSLTNIPYSSLTPELTQDYHERSSLNGYRFAFAAVGTIIGASAVLPIVGLFKTRDAGFSAMGLALGAVMAITTLVTAFSVKEPKGIEAQATDEGFLKTYLAVFKNRPYVILLLTYTLHLTALNSVQGILVYYFKYLYKDEGATTIAMIILLLVAMPFIGVSVLVSKRVGKKLTYQISLVSLAVSCMAIFLFGHSFGKNFFYAMMAVAGVGFGFGYVPPYAMVPDAVEHDAITTGKRKEGSFYGMWTFVSGLGISLSGFIIGWVLHLTGYVANAADQLPSTLFGIRLLVGPIPAAVFLAAAILVQFYPLDEKAYAALMARAAAAAAGPEGAPASPEGARG
jgi:GPH family glycoside/pentoside/hexuronide:cation symporter